jgi:exodeoxyribonuclease III
MTSPPLRVLSYNLWHARAQGELTLLVAEHDPDVLCLQEAHTADLPAELGHLGMAVATPTNRLGVALYVRSARLLVQDARSFHLAKSRHDRWVGGTEQRLAAARVRDAAADREVVLGSFHATPFTDSNAARRRQVDEAHALLDDLGPGLPSLMAGDYNHPILLFMLGRHMTRQGLTLVRPPTRTFRQDRNPMRGKFDVATLSQMAMVDAATLQQGKSDHMPVLFTLAYRDEA